MNHINFKQVKGICFVYFVLYSLLGFSQENSVLEKDIISFGQPNQEQLESFFSEGVEIVIDLRGPQENRGYDEESFLQSMNLAYYSLPIIDEADISYENAKVLQDIISKVDGKVLMHCGSGNRVGAMLALIARLEGLEPDAALALGEEKHLSSLRPLIIELLEQPTD
jgi:protein tyrosine phosphatase (PTP) superfamily phosphohydrolase (DUF442 family)